MYVTLLVDISIHLQDSSRHTRVEVVLHGETEGEFLEDWGVHWMETMGNVSRLGGFRRCVAKRETDHSVIEISSLLARCRHGYQGRGYHR